MSNVRGGSMKIRHKEHGEVEGVNAFYDRRSQIGWVKDGAVRFIADGWSEVPETRLVDVTDKVSVEDKFNLYIEEAGMIGGIFLSGAQHGYAFEKVDRYDLPEDFIQKLNNSLHDAFDKRHTYPSLSTMNWLQQFKKPSLIIQKEEPCQ